MSYRGPRSRAGTLGTGFRRGDVGRPLTYRKNSVTQHYTVEQCKGDRQAPGTTIQAWAEDADAARLACSTIRRATRTRPARPSVPGCSRVRPSVSRHTAYASAVCLGRSNLRRRLLVGATLPGYSWTEGRVVPRRYSVPIADLARSGPRREAAGSGQQGPGDHAPIRHRRPVARRRLPAWHDFHSARSSRRLGREPRRDGACIERRMKAMLRRPARLGPARSAPRR